MPVTNYYSANGELYGESTGGTMTTYMTDALGSAIGTFQAGAVANTYTYTPYGRATRSGSGADPKFLWNGRSQYRTSARVRAEEYVETRHYDAIDARWIGVDGFWPSEPAFAYVAGNPTSFVDATGQRVGGQGNTCVGGTNQNQPPDCSKCNLGRNCKAVWLTCYGKKPGKDTAVYCGWNDTCEDQVCIPSGVRGYPVLPDDESYPSSAWAAIDQCRDRSGTWTLNTEHGVLVPPIRDPRTHPCRGHLISVKRQCGPMCLEYNKAAGTPAFGQGDTLCVGGLPGNRTVNDCGCGQQMPHKPYPDSWLDIGMESEAWCNSHWTKHWACVCIC